MSKFDVKVRNKLTNEVNTWTIARTGMDESEIKPHVESQCGPAGSPPCWEYVSHEVLGGKYHFSPPPEPKQGEASVPEDRADLKV